MRWCLAGCVDEITQITNNTILQDIVCILCYLSVSSSSSSPSGKRKTTEGQMDV